MNSMRIGLVILGAAAGLGAWLSLDIQTVEQSSPRTSRARVNPFTASASSSASPADDSSQREALATAIDQESEAYESNTNVRAPKMTLDELLDALDADIGEEGEPIDREAVRALLRADPELTRTLTPVGPTSVGHSTVRLKPDPL